MADAVHITPEMQRAIELLRAEQDIQITDDLRPTSDGELEFRCTVPVLPHPNPENLPQRANLRVRLNPAFPYHEVEIYAEDPEIRGFPHQDAETHKLCVLPKRDAPLDPGRLKVFIAWVREWLSDAATQNLLKKGDPYELPDFSRRKLADDMPTDLPLLFDESPESFAHWKDRVGQVGNVELTSGRTTRGLLVKEFRAKDGFLIRQWSYTDTIVDPKDRLWGKWILLPKITYERNRPPQTYPELQNMCAGAHISLQALIKDAQKYRNKEPATSFILVGFPIPRKVGDESQEIHWQPMFFSSQHVAHLERDPHSHKTSSKIRDFNRALNKAAHAGQGQIQWGKSENISVQRMYARGANESFLKKNVVLAGCGALGSMIAEMVARGGAPKLALLDAEMFEIGNQCRHTLDGRNLRRGKAPALASRLQSCNPLSWIEGFSTSLPPSIELRETQAKVTKAIDEANIIIDCTTDEDAFHWLDRISRRTHARMVSMYVNFGVTVLTLCISGRTTSCSKVCQMLYEDIDEGRTPITAKEHSGAPEPDELVIPGAGCWTSTFPGTNAQIWSLATVAMDALNQILLEPIKTEGIAAMFKRRGGSPAEGQAPIETVWLKRYR